MRFVQRSLKVQDAMPARVVMLLSDVVVLQNVSIFFTENKLPCWRVVWSKCCFKFFLDVPIRADNQLSLFGIRSASFKKDIHNHARAGPYSCNMNFIAWCSRNVLCQEVIRFESLAIWGLLSTPISTITTSPLTIRDFLSIPFSNLMLFVIFFRCHSAQFNVIRDSLLMSFSPI